MSSFERGASPTLSMREKSLLKRRINKEHNSNFRAGYVNINEEQLHKTGIRGRKRYVVYVVTVLLALTVIVNILITGTILAVLNIGREGMSALEFIPRGLLLRFLEDSDMGDVLLMQQEFGSLPDQPLELSASDQGKLELQILKKKGSKLTVTGESTVLHSSDGVEILDPDTGENVFSTNNKLLRFPQVARNLDTAQLVTDRVTSDTKERLNIQASKYALLAGYDGVSFGGRTISVKGKNFTFFTSEDLTLDAAEGTRLSFYKPLPIKQETGQIREDVLTYKLCVDAESGEIFSVSWDAACVASTSPTQ